MTRRTSDPSEMRTLGPLFEPRIDCRDCWGDGTFCPSSPDKCPGCETCERCNGSGIEPDEKAAAQPAAHDKGERT